MRRVAAGLVISCLALASCFGPDPTLTETGTGKPEIEVEFPSEVQAGSTHMAVVTVTNPGPGDMVGFSIEFSLVGKAGGQTVPTPLVAAGSQNESPSLASIDPEPKAVSLEGLRFVFGALDEGDSAEVRFEVIAPAEPGIAANAVIASDTEEIERSRGVRVVTEVTR